MKRLMAWSLVPLCCVAAFFVVHRMHQTDNEKEPPFQPCTWSQFGEYRRLEMLLEGFAIESVIDVPSVDIPDFQKRSLPIKHYLGVADSPLIARGLQAQFGSANKTFIHFRIDADVLPQSDLILCWDKLCTLSEKEIRATLLQFKKSGAKFLLMRHYPQVEKNIENTTGHFQPINWNIPPYNFPEPIIHIMEEGDNGLMSLSLWSLDKL